MTPKQMRHHCGPSCPATSPMHTSVRRAQPKPSAATPLPFHKLLRHRMAQAASLFLGPGSCEWETISQYLQSTDRGKLNFRRGETCIWFSSKNMTRFRVVRKEQKREERFWKGYNRNGNLPRNYTISYPTVGSGRNRIKRYVCLACWSQNPDLGPKQRIPTLS